MFEDARSRERPLDGGGSTPHSLRCPRPRAAEDARRSRHGAVRPRAWHRVGLYQAYTRANSELRGHPEWKIIMSMRQLVVLATLPTFLGGCGIAAKVNARNDMEASKVAYKSCLSQNIHNVSACEAQRLEYNADLKAFWATSAGIRSGRFDQHQHDTAAISRG